LTRFCSNKARLFIAYKRNLIGEVKRKTADRFYEWEMTLDRDPQHIYWYQAVCGTLGKHLGDQNLVELILGFVEEQREHMPLLMMKTVIDTIIATNSMFGHTIVLLNVARALEAYYGRLPQGDPKSTIFIATDDRNVITTSSNNGLLLSMKPRPGAMTLTQGKQVLYIVILEQLRGDPPKDIKRFFTRLRKQFSDDRSLNLRQFHLLPKLVYHNRDVLPVTDCDVVVPYISEDSILGTLASAETALDAGKRVTIALPVPKSLKEKLLWDKTIGSIYNTTTYEMTQDQNTFRSWNNALDAPSAIRNLIGPKWVVLMPGNSYIGGKKGVSLKDGERVCQVSVSEVNVGKFGTKRLSYNEGNTYLSTIAPEFWQLAKAKFIEAFQEIK